MDYGTYNLYFSVKILLQYLHLKLKKSNEKEEETVFTREEEKAEETS